MKHLPKIRIPQKHDKVYKDECVYSFDTPVRCHRDLIIEHDNISGVPIVCTVSFYLRMFLLVCTLISPRSWDWVTTIYSIITS